MQEKCVGISRSITILFIAIGSAKALTSAISDMCTDITRVHDRDRNKSFLLVVDDLMDVIIRCDSYCRHIGLSTNYNVPGYNETYTRMGSDKG